MDAARLAGVAAGVEAGARAPLFHDWAVCPANGACICYIIYFKPTDSFCSACLERFLFVILTWTGFLPERNRSQTVASGAGPLLPVGAQHGGAAQLQGLPAVPGLHHAGGDAGDGPAAALLHRFLPGGRHPGRRQVSGSLVEMKPTEKPSTTTHRANSKLLRALTFV